MTDYAMLLKESGLKATFQRMNILNVVDKHGHMSVEAIYEEVTKVHPSLSLATIYKNIILMQESAILVEVPIAGRKSKYELAKEDHMHLICTKCGEVEDKMCLDKTDAIFHQLTEEEHFKLNKRQVNLYGVCEACQTQKAS
ncbi:Fur family transcriptional regulator [Sulfurovum riftiae]|uniref:Fur family transcriptional regulator n=1 Tax=Sulfurovum riftiae TaxID=1630136 RepID=A0A151CG88_9BACT|nr:Fur family transcriptional regulator [Sulfurovum riftiae]KYJ86517.1 Fur family transcriptional regulator [Sulfurovum riftiae]